MDFIYIARDIIDVIFGYVDDPHIWGMTCHWYNAKYKTLINHEIMTKYTRNFARMCTVCGQIEASNALSWNEKMWLGNYVYEYALRRGYDSDKITIDGMTIREMDLDDPPVAIEFLANQCRRYLKDRGLHLDTFMDSEPHEVCNEYIYFHGFNVEYLIELAERFRRGERYMFQQIRAQITSKDTSARLQLWYNKLTHPLSRNRPLCDKEREIIKDKLGGFGLGFTWHSYG